MAFFLSSPSDTRDFAAGEVEVRKVRGRIGPLLAGLCLLCLAGCSKLISLPEVDLDQPGWTVWEGQALWTPRADRPALAGDLIVARNRDGDVLVSFSKSPFPIFTAQTSGNEWRIDFIDKGRSYSGFGRPPKKFVWFQLPGLLEGGSLKKPWKVDRPAENEWLLANPKTGEKIRVVLEK